MSALKYPVGMATFSELIEEGFAYVDKTAFIKPLISQGKFIFLSRPRRFGKSLLLSTLEAYFEGRRELFKGLAADSMDLDWTPSPVLHIDLNTGKYDDPRGLENRLTAHLERYEKRYGITPRNEYDTALRFENLIYAVHEKTGRSYFHQGIEDLADTREEDFEETLLAMRSYYDGYLFSIKGSRLYNPYSVLTALANEEIDPYWFDSGTPTFLARRIKKRNIFPPDINGQKCMRKDLMAVGLNDRNPIPLMFQTGYLTIGNYNKDTRLYELRFPNREVEIGFYEELLPVYVGI